MKKYKVNEVFTHPTEPRNLVVGEEVELTDEQALSLGAKVQALGGEQTVEIERDETITPEANDDAAGRAVAEDQN